MNAELYGSLRPVFYSFVY